jgi:hypothetical protein
MPAIDINLRVSSLFLSLLLVVASFSLLFIFTLPLSLFLKSVLVIGVLIYSLDIFWRHGLLKSRHVITRISFNATGWQVWKQDEKLAVELCGDSTVTNLVAVLRFKSPNNKSKYSSLIFFDSLPPEGYRQLMVLLRTNRASSAERVRRGSL